MCSAVSPRAPGAEKEKGVRHLPESLKEEALCRNPQSPGPEGRHLHHIKLCTDLFVESRRFGPAEVSSGDTGHSPWLPKVAGTLESWEKMNLSHGGPESWRPRAEWFHAAAPPLWGPQGSAGCGDSAEGYSARGTGAWARIGCFCWFGEELSGLATQSS